MCRSFSKHTSNSILKWCKYKKKIYIYIHLLSDGSHFAQYASIIHTKTTRSSTCDDVINHRLQPPCWFCSALTICPSKWLLLPHVCDRCSLRMRQWTMMSLKGKPDPRCLIVLCVKSGYICHR